MGKTKVVCVAGLPENTDPRNLGKIVSFKHPRTEEYTRYLVTEKDSNGYMDVFEFQKTWSSGTEFSSWFVEGKLVTDGSLYISSKIDPKFLLLPVLESHGLKYSPIEQILTAGNERALLELIKCKNLFLKKICDINDRLGPETILYRLNEDKVLTWLISKIKRTVNILSAQENKKNSASKNNKFCVSSKSANTACDTNTHSTDETISPHLSQALDLVCEYLSSKWAQKLTEHYQVKENEIEKENRQNTVNKRNRWEDSVKQDELLELSMGMQKRPKVENGNGTTAGSATAAKRKSVAASKLEKVNKKGMKSMMSFFGKK